MSKETGSSEFSFCSTTDSSHSLGASHFLLPLPFSVWKMGVFLTSFTTWSVRHVPRHSLGEWFSPWLKKSLREAQARVISNRRQGKTEDMGLSEALHGPALLLQVESWEQREAGRQFPSCFLLQHILGADQLQKDATQSASLQLRLLSSSAVSTTPISHVHVRAALQDPCRHTQVLSYLMSYGVDMFLQLWLPSCTHTAAGDILLLPAPEDTALPLRPMGLSHSSTQPKLRHIAGPQLGDAHVDVDVSDTKLYRARKEQVSTSCTLWGHQCPHPGWLPLLAFWGLDWKDSWNTGAV